MAGYIDNKTRVLNEWYQLFTQKHRILSIEEVKHWEYVMKLSLTSFKNDYWELPSLKEFLENRFVFHENNNLDISKYEELNLSIDCHRLVFINGKFSSEFSDGLINPWILKIDQSSNRYNISHRPIRPTMFMYLTECLSDATVHIKLPNESITKKPLYLLYINEGSAVSNQLVTAHYYHHLEIGTNTNSCIIEHFVSINEYSHFTGSRVCVSIGERSKLDHIKFTFENNKSYHISNQDINLKQSSSMKSSSFIILGPQFTCHNINSQVNHIQSSLFLNSLVLLSKNDIGDIQTYLEHNNQDYSVSKQLHKIIANDHSTGIFNGLIKVNQNSINTDSKMINNNLLLHKSASIYSIPKLEIYSDSVQCSHGATIGQINLDHLFYLNTRGIFKKAALKMLIYAFTTEITKTIKNSSLKDFVLTRINRALIRRI